MDKFTFRVSADGRHNVMSHLGLRNVYAGKLLQVNTDNSKQDAIEEVVDGKTITKMIPSIKGELTIPTSAPEGSEFVITIDTTNVNELDVVYELLAEYPKYRYVGPEFLFFMIGRIR